MPIMLPSVQLNEEYYATIDKRLNEVRITNGKDFITFIPMDRIKDLCKVV
jgi:hypothetical protein